MTNGLLQPTTGGHVEVHTELPLGCCLGSCGLLGFGRLGGVLCGGGGEFGLRVDLGGVELRTQFRGWRNSLDRLNCRLFNPIIMGRGARIDSPVQKYVDFLIDFSNYVTRKRSEVQVERSYCTDPMCGFGIG